MQVTISKWGGLPHWSAEGVLLLGENQHGTWLGQLPGTHDARPGLEFGTQGDQAMLLPRDRGFTATSSSRW